MKPPIMRLAPFGTSAIDSSSVVVRIVDPLLDCRAGDDSDLAFEHDIS
jgi:hypothetical protein